MLRLAKVTERQEEETLPSHSRENVVDIKYLEF